MAMMKLQELLKHFSEIKVADSTISGLENDSRNVKPGDLFIAYPGASSDGRQYIAQAIASGAAAVLYDPQGGYSLPQVDSDLPCVPIEQLAERLDKIARIFYKDPSKALTITGVTGTNGKTSIAYQLAQAHALLGQKSAYIGTIGQGEVDQLKPLANTTPDALCLQKLFADYRQQGISQVCMEVSSHALSQGRVDGVCFTQAIYTNLSLDHLDYHHSMQDYAQAKALLFSRPELQYAIINQDDEYAEIMRSAIPKDCKQLSYGLHQPADIKVSDWQMSMQGTALQLDSPWGKQRFTLQSLGAFNIYNALAIFSSLMAAGYPVEKVTQTMTKLRAAPGRLEVVSNNPLIIVDYAHTPDALKNVLMTLNQVKKGRLMVVFGCGGDRDKSKRPLMAEVASDLADRLFMTSDNPRTEDPEGILNDMEKGLKIKTHCTREIDRKKAIQQAIDEADTNDIVLIAGKGHEDYQIIGKEIFPFSDQDVVREYLYPSLSAP